MEEELNENDLEERLYAMLHHVDETQNNLIDSHHNKFDTVQLVENGPRSTVRRYWRTAADTNPYSKVNASKDPAPAAATNPYQKVNALKDPAPAAATNPYQKVNASKDPAPAATKTVSTTDSTKPKEEKSISPHRPPSPVDLSLFQSPFPLNVKTTIEFLDHEDASPVLLESSDEDEVVEIALPPKPTITIESSDEEELQVVKPVSLTKSISKEQKSNSGERAISASPVPSGVSSVSDEFIHSDCIALNISSRHPDKHSFDFSLHGSDLLVPNTPSKKKKRKKNKEVVTSTPSTTPVEKSANEADGCFATPKSKAKNKKQKTKLLTEKLITRLDVYDSDSNQSIVETNRNKNPYIVTEKSLPCVDVYESDSNQSEIVKEINTDQSKTTHVFEEAYSSDSSVSNDKLVERNINKTNIQQSMSFETVDLTDNENISSRHDINISENIVMANVTGFRTPKDHGDENSTSSSNKDISKYVSSKVPQILYEDLDFDNLKGKDKYCKKRHYSLTTLRAEMEKFYNESWGGEDFNHREIQRTMSRDKSLWAIDPKDRMPSLAQRKAKCNYCNRVGHRDDSCRQKPPVCYMCGNTGHFEPRCPSKICVNCGAPNFMYSTRCRNCSSWSGVTCAECGQPGHPASHCPDVWRRYHNTISTDVSLEMCTQPKHRQQLFCSGCCRRGHLVHACRSTVPFSGLPINTPFVRFYRPVFGPLPEQGQPARSKSFSGDTPQRPDRNKRRSKSPTNHETHSNKRRNVSVGETEVRNARGPAVGAKNPLKDVETPKNKSKRNVEPAAAVSTTEKAPDFISVASSNRDPAGHVIQDNEVSDTSHVVTSARIYVTADIIGKLTTKEGEEWLKATSSALNVTVAITDVHSFLSIKGKLVDQETFQCALREWTQAANKTKNPHTANNSEEAVSPSNGNNLPKNRAKLLRQLNKSLDSLKEDLGDPKALYKELTYSQNKHENLLKQKVISPIALSNSRNHINDMLKKLNTILIGQAGLDDGTEHVNILQSYKQKLLNHRQKHVSPSVRQQIGEHYHRIFSSSARNDYTELVKKYYISNTTVQLAKKKKKRKPVKPKPNNAILVDNNTIPTEESGKQPVPNTAVKKNFKMMSKDKIKLRQALSNYKRKLEATRYLVGPATKKEIMQIMRKLHTFIIMIQKRENFTSKMDKKLERVMQQAQKFCCVN